VDDFGGELYIYSPTDGLVSVHNNTPDTGHGFYDVGALDFGGESIIGGGFDGYILRYSVSDEVAITDSTVYRGDSTITAYPSGARPARSASSSPIRAGTRSSSPRRTARSPAARPRWSRSM